jgi:hypothetical protein
MKLFAIMLALFPLVAFCIAGVTELRSTRSGTEKLRSLIPVAMGIAAFALSVNPQLFLRLTPDSSVTLSRVMTIISAAISCSGVFITYSRRSSAVWMACGGLLMALCWMFNRILV